MARYRSPASAGCRRLLRRAGPLARIVAGLDQLIDELLASRLGATRDAPRIEADRDLTALVAEECARLDCQNGRALTASLPRPR